MTMRERVLATLRREHMLPPEASVAVGLSGGADSVSLLHLLLSLRDELRLREVVAVHINHGLRGAEALRDQRFVEALCATWQVPLTVHTCDVAALAAERHLGVEEAGRLVRYEQFNAAAAALPNGYAATAHTASDNTETVLLHLCRGTGLHGLCGIPPVRGHVVRPLIDCTREDVEGYCEENGIAFITDSTNTDVQYSRNRIRARVLPELKAINPQVETAIGRLIQRAREWETAANRRADELLQRATNADGSYDRELLCSADAEVQGVVLRRLLGEHGEQRGSDTHIAAARELLTGGGRLSLPQGREMQVVGRRVLITDTRCGVKPFCFTDLQPECVLDIDGTAWRLRTVSRVDCEQILNISNWGFANACDYDKIVGSLCVRQRETGDAYHPAGRGCGKTLKKLYNESALTEAERDALPVLCDDNGIVLVAGYGCDERVRITDETATVLLLEKTGVKKNGIDA